MQRAKLCLHGENDVLPDGQVAHDALRLPVIGQIAHAKLHGVDGILDFPLLAIHLQGAGLASVRAVDGPGQLASAAAQQAGEAHHLALVDFQIIGLDFAGMAQTLGLDFQRLLGEILILSLPDGGQIVKVLAHHGCHQLHPGQLLDAVFPHQLAVTQHGDAVADCVDLLQKVGDKNYANALIPQPTHHAKELLHLVVIQRRRRLVQNQDLTFHINRPGNGDHLLHCQRVLFQVSGHVNVQLHVLHELGSLGDHDLALNGSEFCQRLPADKQILCHRQIGAEVDFLIHGGNAFFLGVQRVLIDHRAVDSVNVNLTGLEFVDAGQAFDQRGFTGAVLAHQGPDLSLFQGEIHTVQCLDAGKCHADTFHFQYCVFFHVSPPSDMGQR